MILDSNIIIYAAIPRNEKLRDFIESNAPLVSVVSRVEVLGFRAIRPDAMEYFARFFAAAGSLPVSSEVIDRAVSLRQTRKMSLGDALIAATALANDLPLVTRNTKDFEWIDSLELIDPLAA
ncbi:MAG: type II toxin-antitoxin system VapC family toxin [Pyrinomonadaceae bacterium]|nr:type II toxin-antitoxin system VapC family toxin [Pyrinomonadaceae bacterium]